MAYTVPLAELGIACETLEFGLREHSVDGIILGGTEIPLLLGAQAAAEDLINPAELLAEAAIRHAIG